MRYEVRFIRTVCLDNPIVEAENEKEAIEKASHLIHKYDFREYETTEVIQVDEDDQVITK